jgi:predicted amidohydrolase YtcJ
LAKNSFIINGVKMTNRIFYNGNIYTADKYNTFAQAMYVENGKIKFIGSNEQVQKYENTADGIIDLSKRTVVPGFIDSHIHLLAYGKTLDEIDLSSCKSIDELIETSKKYINENCILKNNNCSHSCCEDKDNTKSEKWLTGYGWNQENFDSKAMPTKHDLDRISKDIPILFKRACLHIATCNSKLLEIAGIKVDTKIDGGQVDVLDNDTTGILRENAINLINDYMPAVTRADKKAYVLKAIEKLSSYGITGIHTDDLGSNNGGVEMLDIYKELDMENRLKLRLYIQSRITSYDEAKKYFEIGFDKCQGNDNFRIGSIKLLGDGSLGGQTAAMNEPYENTSEMGIALFSQEELNNIVDISHKNSVSVVIHAIGDRTIDMAIKSFEIAMKKYPHINVRHGIVHCQITSKEALNKIKKNNILAYIQPIFIAADSKIVEKRVGKERMKYSYNWKTLQDSSVVLTFSSDSPVESPNPYENIYCAVTRKDLSKKPESEFLSEQKLTVIESIKAYTINSAYASYEENIKGSLEVGKLADFAVLSDNIFEINSDRIKDISCVMTVKGGEIVFDN